MVEEIITLEEAPEGTPSCTYVPLHVYTDYCIGNSIAKIIDLVKKAKSLNMKALALTDYTLAGSMYFYRLCTANKIKPVIGETVSFCTTKIILLCRDLEAYKILCMYSKELIRLDGRFSKLPFTKEESSHFICITEEYEDDYLKSLFGDSLYTEIISYKLSDESLRHINKSKAVITNPVRFMDKGDVELLNELNEYQSGKKGRHNPDDYFIDESELRPLLQKFDCMELLENTSRIAEKIDYIFPENYFDQEQCIERIKESLPSASEIISGDKTAGFFYQTVTEGVTRRFETLTEEIKERLDYEIKDIVSNGWENLFMMHKTIIDKCDEKGIIHGQGRGTVPSSLVSYVLGISDLNPIENHLIYKRFYNSQTNACPDIDIDYEYDRFDEVIHSIKEIYGEDNVGRIAAYGRIKPNQAMQIAGIALSFPKKELDSFSSLWPDFPDISDTIKILKNNDEEEIEASFESEEKAEMLKAALSDTQYAKLIELSLKVEGVFYCKRLHSSGYVITRKPLNEYVPVEEEVINGKKIQFTSCTASSLDSFGLYRNDLLGSTTLSKLQKIVSKIEATRNIHIDLDSIPLEDDLTMKLFQSADTDDIFLFESSGIKELFDVIHPEKFSDLAAVYALYNAGALELIPDISEDGFDEYGDILDETHGILIYQEQLMFLISRISGCSLAQADLIRMSMKRKDKDLAQRKEEFIEGAVNNGITAEKADRLFEVLLEKSNLLFSKSHALAYTRMSWYEAYLKVHYPKEYNESAEEEEN